MLHRLHHLDHQEDHGVGPGRAARGDGGPGVERHRGKYRPHVSWSQVRLGSILNENNFILLLVRSAPEILLSIVGIVFNNFKQDDLGPSLIVGSGAFNLLVISAIRNNLDTTLIWNDSELTRNILKSSRYIHNQSLVI